ncbi:class I SAM-dependent methyltransferase [bacterium]|nr:class I SAM-dependent methyltransferase [bacterium]MCI0602157.1 class I SAM-dependent methyltransferase [bacterium]
MFFRRKQKSPPRQDVSSNYRVFGLESAQALNLAGWLDPEVALKQDAAYQDLIKQMKAGNVRRDFQVAAKTLEATGIQNPSVLEVGSGSGYYYEILSYLLNRELHYVGVDRSQSMIRLAKKNYPAKPFLAADAARLPFSDRSFDVVFNGVSLMHILEYAEAIFESRRTARSFCIFHTVPVLQDRPTTVLQKSAYGGPVFEVIFNEGELTALLKANHLRIRSSVESIPYNLEKIVSEKTITKTYLCEVLPK